VSLMRILDRTPLLLLIMTLAAGCAPWTPEQTAAFEERERQLSEECARRGGLFVSGSCVSRAGGA
jgi:hypothetical protein